MTIPADLPWRYAHDVQIFNLPSTVTITQWHTWVKPRGISMFYASLLGGGGGGGGGFTGVAASARGGGGGGGSSSHTRVLIPAAFVPEVLYIQVGAGGIGVGSGGGVAGSGVPSFISVSPFGSTTRNFIASTGTSPPGGGGTGTAAAVGAAGSAGAAATAAELMLAAMGQFTTLIGQSGAAGGAVAGAIGGAITLFNTNGGIAHGGTGGAGTTSADFAGGVITAITDSLISDDRPQGAAAGSFNGSGGFLHPRLLVSYCGLGGSSSNAGIGGLGGNGGPGSGGGGGGGGTTGGRGGDGGPGLVIISCW